MIISIDVIKAFEKFNIPIHGKNFKHDQNRRGNPWPEKKASAENTVCLLQLTSYGVWKGECFSLRSKARISSFTNPFNVVLEILDSAIKKEK